jgi:membrane protease YdiL (CAAX protease family)
VIAGADLLFVVLFALVAPALDYGVFWPAYGRLARVEPAYARSWLWAAAIGNLWLLVGFGAALWLASGRSFAAIGLVLPTGWRLWAAIGLVAAFAAYQALALRVLVASAEQRAALRAQFGALAAVLPRTRRELRWFAGASVTAGFCEEVLYRGVFVWVFAPWLGWWGAAALSLPFFAIAHLYQGWAGVLRTGLAGVAFTLLVAAFDSLWPAIVLHALVDLSAGAMAWVALRDGQDAPVPAPQH